jgi:hypothetical protein
MFNILSGIGALVNPASTIASTLIGEIFGGDEEQAPAQPATYSTAPPQPIVMQAPAPAPPEPTAMDYYYSNMYDTTPPAPQYFANGGEVMAPITNPGFQFGVVNPAWQPLATSLNGWLAGNLSGPEAPGVRGYAEGGVVEGEIPDEVIVEQAMQAIAGGGENPEAVIAEFVDRFGDQALADLASRARGQPMAQPAPVSDGKSDNIPARLSEGEFVMPADVVSGLGKGSTDAGVRRLEEMIAKVRAVKSKDVK